MSDCGVSRLSGAGVRAAIVLVGRFAAIGALVTAAMMVLSGCRSRRSPMADELMVTVVERPIAEAVEGPWYVIRKGDTLTLIARRYGVEWRRILEANSALDPLALRPGRVIVIPGGVEPAGALKEEGPAEPVWNAGHDGPLAAERGFRWPLRGTVIGRFRQSVSWRMGERNNGVDIRAAPGQAVAAAKSGRVNTFEDVPGYGRVIVLEHSDGTTTFYGHLRGFLINHGRWARQGELIGTAGSTGRSSGTELHFRIMRGGRCVDPLRYLPR